MNTVPGPGYADQASKRAILRIVGVVSMTVAVVLIGVALADFFRAFNSDDFGAKPTRFWMFFLAMPFFIVGGVCLRAGFLGAAARYVAGESMPVVKDSAAYLSEGEGILGVGRTVDDSRVGAPATGPYCRQCGTRNDPDAGFCDSCGQSLA